ncbi:MAG: 5'-nucleotidase SurE [uncultured Truepera sp.]|uniref:5'-nucleotidase SurE n=1 Tax=uncultured Truepera sp. TaxID=543023 RepID=A0A6J4USX3_9DEIN|nr:MAG: 5'-nucleotidase SurE [uncultured Truepera sp.]
MLRWGMRILISNDDGIYSPGIRALAEVAQGFGEVRIVAPDVEQSATGHAITISRPLHLHATPLDGFDAYRVNGTPADCVALGTHLWEGVELVLSGINLGLNLGHNVWHSGTVAAAKQAAFLDVQAVAFSAPYEGTPPDYELLKPFIRDIIGRLLEEPKMPLVNVNLPAQPLGMRWTRQSVRHYEGSVVPGEDPMGRAHYWFAAYPRTGAEEGTDRWALEHGFVSLTPLRLDLTDEPLLGEAKRLEGGTEVSV